MSRRRGLAGVRVLVTRARGDAEDFAAALRAAGAVPLLAPVIAFGPPGDEAACARAAREADRYDWIAFTSVRGVDAFFERRGGGAPPVAAIAAIGPKTAARVESYGVRPQFVPARAVGEAVAAGLLERTAPGARILIVRAQEGRETLPALLRAAGRDVDDIAAYATRPVRDPSIGDLARAAEVWTFASASAVDAFVANVPAASALSETKIVACIGPVTAEAAGAHELRVTVTAERYDLDGLIDVLERACA